MALTAAPACPLVAQGASVPTPPSLEEVLRELCSQPGPTAFPVAPPEAVGPSPLVRSHSLSPGVRKPSRLLTCQMGFLGSWVQVLARQANETFPVERRRQVFIV